MKWLLGTSAGAMASVALHLLTLSNAAAQDLSSFGVLAGSTVTNVVGLGTSITGNVGVSPGSAITGFPPGVVQAPYSIYATGAVPAQAQVQFMTEYTSLMSRPATADLTGT